MLDFSKISSNNRLEHHCDAICKDIKKAFLEFEEADNLLSKNAVFNSQNSLDSSVKSAIDKGNVQLEQSVNNVDEVLKAISRNPHDSKDIIRKLDNYCQSYKSRSPTRLASQEIKNYWFESFGTWLSKYEDLKARHGVKVGIKIESEYDRSISKFDKGEFESIQEEADFRQENIPVFIFAENTGQDKEDVIKKIIEGEYPGVKRGDKWFVSNHAAEKVYKNKTILS